MWYTILQYAKQNSIRKKFLKRTKFNTHNFPEASSRVSGECTETNSRGSGECVETSSRGSGECVETSSRVCRKLIVKHSINQIKPEASSGYKRKLLCLFVIYCVMVYGALNVAVSIILGFISR